MMMKTLCLFTASLGVGYAFLPSSDSVRTVSFQLGMQVDNNAVVTNSRMDFLKQISVSGASAAAALIWNSEPAQARGRATLEKSFERYGSRVRTGGEFYKTDLRKLVEKSDWTGIKNALQEPPSRQKGDLNKADAGVAERAKQAGGFSDARVLVAADLLAGAFSDNSISPKTKKMQAYIARLREIVEEMQKTARQALGEESSGGLFGFGGKAPSQAELTKQSRTLYIEGGNVWNQYIAAVNDDLALQFERLEYIK
jgi:hypothetical protein